MVATPPAQRTAGATKRATTYREPAPPPPNDVDEKRNGSTVRLALRLAPARCTLVD